MATSSDMTFAENKSVAAAADLDTMDLGRSGPDLGASGFKLVVQVTEDIGSTGTYTVQWQQSDSATSGFTDVSDAKVTIPAGKKKGTKPLVIAVPYGVTKRYFKAKFAKTGTTSGKITVYMATGEVDTGPESQIWTNYF